MAEEKSFVVRLKDEKYCPSVVCGRCGEPIVNYLDATVAWIQTNEYQDGALHKVTVLCKKNGCTAGILIPGVRSQSMREYLSALAFNLEPNFPERSERRGIRNGAPPELH